MSEDNVTARIGAVGTFIDGMTAPKLVSTVVLGGFAYILYLLYENRTQVWTIATSDWVVSVMLAVGVLVLLLGWFFKSLNDRINEQSTFQLADKQRQLDEERARNIRICESKDNQIAELTKENHRLELEFVNYRAQTQAELVATIQRIEQKVNNDRSN